MNIITRVFKSTVGKKYIMAVTGFFLMLFVIGHLAGNLQVFGGPEMINRYGNFLQTNLEVIWPVRILLMIFLVLHIWSAARLSAENYAARPVAYSVYRPVGSSYASRSMLMSGIMLFIFVCYHILHYTAQVTYLNGTQQDFTTFVDPKKQHDIFKMMVVGFRNGWVSAFYIAGIGLLCLHLSHGAQSMFQSIGWKNDVYRPLLEKAAVAVAVLIFLGYISIPVAILLGFGSEALQPAANAFNVAL
jgi:succinate dehydrogenase / fumarate reductase, cytochrome b subunit